MRRGVRHISPSLPRPSEGEEGVDEDVVEEEERMKDLLQHRTGEPSLTSFLPSFLPSFLLPSFLG